MLKIKTKITMKLSLIIIILLTFLIAIVLASQLFILSRLYFTTEYTKNKENALLVQSQYISDIELRYKDNEEKIREILNDFAYRNVAYCMILDEDKNIKYKSDNLSELGNVYVNNILNSAKNERLNSSVFRIAGYLKFPSRYIAVSTIIYPDELETIEDQFIAVTKEVYTDENYKVLRTYSIYIFFIAMIFVVIFGMIFSYIITRPILSICETTEKISRLDFTQRCSYKSEDEIGKLAGSINFLTQKLSDTIGKLKDKNTKLKDDLEIQREVDKFRKEFIASVSHEFKTPLTLIRGFNEVIMSGRVEGEELVEAQNIIMDEVDRMDNLVQQLLDLSKLESDNYQLKRTNFDCVKLLKNVTEKYIVVSKEKNIKLLGEFSSQEVLVNADKMRIEQVIINFITNAINYTNEGGRIIVKDEVDENSITISVFNEGSNIKERDLDRIWEKFYRADKSRSKKTGGTGLGLAICKDILEKHGSIYGVENTRDGVKFYFKLIIKK